MNQAIVVLVALSGIAAALVTGAAENVIQADTTGLVWAVLVAVFVGTVSAFNERRVLTWMCDHGITLMLGLLGTVLGFMTAATGASTGDEAVKLAGVGTALATTVCGILGQLYLLILERFGE